MDRSQEPDVFGKVSQHQEEKEVHSEVATDPFPWQHMQSLLERH